MDYEEFLYKYPEGRLADKARAKIADLKENPYIQYCGHFL